MLCAVVIKLNGEQCTELQTALKFHAEKVWQFTLKVLEKCLDFAVGNVYEPWLLLYVPLAQDGS